MRPLLLPCAATGVSLVAMWCLSGATPRGQPWMPAVTLSHEFAGLSTRRMVVLGTFRGPSLGRQAHRELLRTAWLDFAPSISATACHQRNYVETYSRSISFRETIPSRVSSPSCCPLACSAPTRRLGHA